MNFDEITARVFAKLGQEKQLREYHEIIYQLIGVVIDFINANGESLKLSRGKHFNRFCMKLRETEEGRKLCHACDLCNAAEGARSKNPLIYSCHAGFVEILVPLFGPGGNYIGSMTAGQFHRKGQNLFSRADIAELAAKLGFDPEEMYSFYIDAPVLTPEQVDGLIQYLETIGRLLVNTHTHLLFMESINAPDKIETIRKYIEENYRKELSILSVSRKFYMSPGYFSHFFRKETGTGFNSYLNLYRVAKSKEMLSETELNISEIAFLCGFCSISQFNRTFKSVTSQSPREFRKA